MAFDLLIIVFFFVVVPVLLLLPSLDRAYERFMYRKELAQLAEPLRRRLNSRIEQLNSRLMMTWTDPQGCEHALRVQLAQLKHNQLFLELTVELALPSTLSWLRIDAAQRDEYTPASEEITLRGRHHTVRLSGAHWHALHRHAAGPEGLPAMPLVLPKSLEATLRWTYSERGAPLCVSLLTLAETARSHGYERSLTLMLNAALKLRQECIDLAGANPDAGGALELLRCSPHATPEQLAWSAEALLAAGADSPLRHHLLKTHLEAQDMRRALELLMPEDLPTWRGWVPTLLQALLHEPNPGPAPDHARHRALAQAMTASLLESAPDAPGLGRLPWAQHPQACGATLLAWLERHPTDPAARDALARALRQATGDAWVIAWRSMMAWLSEHATHEDLALLAWAPADAWGRQEAQALVAWMERLFMRGESPQATPALRRALACAMAQASAEDLQKLPRLLVNIAGTRDALAALIEAQRLTPMSEAGQQASLRHIRQWSSELGLSGDAAGALSLASAHDAQGALTLQSDAGGLTLSSPEDAAKPIEPSEEATQPMSLSSHARR